MTYVADEPAAAAAGQQAARATVVVNRSPLSPDVVAALTRAYGSVKPGRYWYDPVSGLWGLEGGPYMGQITPGLALGGPLPADISVGGTGTFINGREIHPMEYAALMRAYGQVYPGRFWLIPDGTFGQEGGPAMGNLRAQTGRGGSNGGSWSAYSPFAGTTGGDANGCLYFSGGDTSWSNC